MQFSVKIKDTLLKNSTALPKAASAEQVALYRERWREEAAAADPALQSFMLACAEDPHGEKLLEALFGNSPYLSRSLLNELPFFRQMAEQGYAETFRLMMDTLVREVEACTTRESLMALLRIAKRRASLLIALADITGVWKLEKVTESLSAFADTSICATVRFLLREGEKSGAIALADSTNPEKDSGLLVLAMGKLGAGELNYSSDIDLIVFYDQNRVRYQGRHTAGQFFIRLAQGLTSILQDRTREGYVFRTDLRLRPDPGSNPIAVSIHNAGLYYETLGQNWERAAMIKARPVIGDEDTIQRFRGFITPYIWRRSLDFASIQDIHSIKRQIDSRQGGLPANLYNYNVKLGRGGIREIEFFAQTQQLIWGGRQPNLRSMATCDTLRALVEAGELRLEICDELIYAYRFYRKVEHRLQMIEDQQTHTLPDTPEKMQRIAVFLGYKDAVHFVEELTLTISRVRNHYAHLFENSPSLASGDPNSGGSLVFTGADDDPETLETLKGMGFSDASHVASAIRGWHHGRYRAMRTKRARELLTELMPILLTAFSRTANPDAAFDRFNEFLSKLPAGVQIFSLFYSNPNLLDLIAEIMGGYPYIASNLSRAPVLLDYVLIPEFYDRLPKGKALKANLREAVAQGKDMEDALNAMRFWTNDRRFRIGIQCIKKTLPLHKAARNLSGIADAVIDVLMEEVRKDFEKTHGIVENGTFAVLGMGKLGGKEMTFSSDLDLVFVYDVPDSDALSTGAQPLPVSQYYARLSRRFVNALTSLTPEGTLYNVDLRLRPSGNDGPVVSHICAFVDYYKKSAWAWEYLALTRARVIHSPKPFKQHLKSLIRGMLSEKRDPLTFAEGVLDMYSRFRKAHPVTFPFRVKYTPGGLIELEYIAQYLQVKHAHLHPAVLSTNTVKAFKRLRKEGLLDQKAFTALMEAIALYTQVQGTMRLMGARQADEHTMTPGMERTLIYHTSDKDFETLRKKLTATQKNVENLFERFILSDTGETP